MREEFTPVQCELSAEEESMRVEELGQCYDVEVAHFRRGYPPRQIAPYDISKRIKVMKRWVQSNTDRYMSSGSSPPDIPQKWHQSIEQLHNTSTEDELLTAGFISAKKYGILSSTILSNLYICKTEVDVSSFDVFLARVLAISFARPCLPRLSLRTLDAQGRY